MQQSLARCKKCHLLIDQASRLASSSCSGRSLAGSGPAGIAGCCGGSSREKAAVRPSRSAAPSPPSIRLSGVGTKPAPVSCARQMSMSSLFVSSSTAAALRSDAHATLASIEGVKLKPADTNSSGQAALNVKVRLCHDDEHTSSNSPGARSVRQLKRPPLTETSTPRSAAAAAAGDATHGPSSQRSQKWRRWLQAVWKSSSSGASAASRRIHTCSCIPITPTRQILSRRCS